MKHSLDAMKCDPPISFCKALTGGFFNYILMTKLQVLISMQMKLEWMEINYSDDTGLENWYAMAVKDYAKLVGLNPDDYWANYK
jgi:hypothetical protein